MKMNMVTITVIDGEGDAEITYYSIKPRACQQLREYLKQLERDGLAMSMDETEGDDDE